jgi:hypothetical protein
VSTTDSQRTTPTPCAYIEVRLHEMRVSADRSHNLGIAEARRRTHTSICDGRSKQHAFALRISNAALLTSLKSRPSAKCTHTERSITEREASASALSIDGSSTIRNGDDWIVASADALARGSVVV